LGFLDGPQLSLDLDESATVTSSQLSSSPPTGRMSPPQPTTPAQTSSSDGKGESLELQVDYWPLRTISNDGKDKNQSKSQDQSKNSVKSSFKNFHVIFFSFSLCVVCCYIYFLRLTHHHFIYFFLFWQVSRLLLHTQSSEPTNAMTLFFSAKEKKQKSNFHLTSSVFMNFMLLLHFLFLVYHFFFLFHTVMRLGKKKEKDRDGEKEQCIDGIARLICSAKQSHPAPLRGELQFFFSSFYS
jgi:hypothetical protein